MSVASSVIERNTYLQQPTRNEAAALDADQLHNARMKNNLARLLDPSNTTEDVVASIDAEGNHVIRSTPVEEEPQAPLSAHDMLYGPRRNTKATVTRGIVANNQPVQPAAPARQPVYMVTNARADSDLFRADSPINRQVYASTPAEAYAAARAMADAMAAAAPAPAAAPAAVQPVQVANDESEDLRPTATTIQYQTIGADGSVVINSPATAQQNSTVHSEENTEKKFTLTRRDKTVIGVIVGLILAVFVLIIVNSAVISGLNNDIEILEERASAIQTESMDTAAAYEELVSHDNVYNVALEMGWID